MIPHVSFPRWFWLVVLPMAILIRLALIPNPGFEADVSFWKSWGLATYDKGIIEGIKATNNNYPTPFAYTLGAMVWVYSVFQDPHNFNEFWQNTNLLFLFVSKLPSVAADFGIAGIILWIGKHAKKLGFPIIHNSYFIILASLYVLNPISLIDGAWWGQVDSVGVVLFLLAFVFALKKMPFLAGVVYMVALMTKLQNMIYGPLFFLFIWQLTGPAGLVRAASGALIGFFGLNIEFLLTHNMGRVVASLTENYDYFPWMSLNAFNLWWIVAGGHGMQVSDKLLAIGLTNAKTVGLLLFSSFYLFAIINLLRRRGESGRGEMSFFEHRHVGYGAQGLSMHAYLTDAQKKRHRAQAPEDIPAAGSAIKTFLENLILVNAAFFLFQTESHDRYAFPLSVFILLLAPFLMNHEARITNYAKNRHFQLFIILYSLFTIFYFYNLHTALVLNYPTNGIPGLSSLTHPFFTIATSIALLGLFVVFLISIARHSKSIVIVATAALPITILLFSNLPLLLKKPVSLTKLSPYIYTQSYGQLTKNMPVNASTGWREWHFLSVQYAFYRKGFGTHANSRMDFDIGKKFKRFTTDVGIDTEAGSAGSAIFEIYGDNSLLYSSGVIKRFELPKHADVDISSVRFLTLITTDGGDGITDDHTDWLNPILWP